jgi:hypothetical protein
MNRQSSNSGGVRRTFGWIVLLPFLFNRCGGEDRAVHAMGTQHIGASVTDLVSEAGPPTLERSVSRMNGNDLCNRNSDRVAVRALEYHLPTSGFSYYLRKLIRVGPLMTIIVCVDSSQVVSDIHTVQQ